MTRRRGATKGSIASRGNCGHFHGDFAGGVAPRTHGPVSPSLPHRRVVVPVPRNLSLRKTAGLKRRIDRRCTIDPTQFCIGHVVHPGCQLTSNHVVATPVPMVTRPRDGTSRDMLTRVTATGCCSRLPLRERLSVFRHRKVRLDPSAMDG